jgi:hypothetical protein
MNSKVDVPISTHMKKDDNCGFKIGFDGRNLKLLKD